MSIFNDGTFPAIWVKIKHVFHDDVEPVLETFFKQFAGDEGKLILSTALAYAPQLLTGNFGVISALVIKELLEKSTVIASQDVEHTLQQVQSALQIAKVSQGIATPKDQDIIANVAATEKATPQEA